MSSIGSAPEPDFKAIMNDKSYFKDIMNEQSTDPGFQEAENERVKQINEIDSRINEIDRELPALESSSARGAERSGDRITPLKSERDDLIAKKEQLLNPK